MEGTEDLAYFREYESTDQCELQFLINTEIQGFGAFKEEVKAVRKRSDTVSSLLEHIKNKLQKLLKDQSNKQDENVLTTPICVSLKRGKKSLRGAMVLRNISDSFKADDNVMFQVFNQKFVVLLNAPLVKQLKLPVKLYANFSIQPIKYHAIFADNAHSMFTWYKSINNIDWEKVGEGYVYSIKEEDMDNYLKLVCVPCNEKNVKGPSMEDVSKSKVERMGELPTCPFEKRHKYTRNWLKKDQFRVVSYNILAERYTTDSENYAYCAPEALAADYRKQLILKELLGYKADIICLQEVDNRHYAKYFKNKFKEAGYCSVYHRKGNRIPEGLACVYNKTRFKQIDSKHIVLREQIEKAKVFSYLWDLIKGNEEVKNLFLRQSTSLQVTVFKTIEGKSKRCLIVGNTHLFYHPEADHIRLLQVNMATTYLSMLKRRYLNDGHDVSVLFCGDFNSAPQKSVFPYMIEGRIHPEHTDCLKINENGRALLHHNFVLESCCGTPRYTNYTPDFKGCLDYIFAESNKVSVLEVVPLTEEEELNKYEGLPNKYFPSDHLALVVDLKFKEC